MSESSTRHARIVWRGDSDDLRAHEITLADQVLAGSCSALWGGDPTKADPEEMFVASISACHMLWFLDFARRERLRVISYVDDPVGTMDDVRFTEVLLRPHVALGNQPVPPEALHRLHERAHEACFIANSLHCPVRVEPRES